MKLPISTEIFSAAAYIGEARTIELLAEAGFDCFDFSMFSMVRMNWATGQFYDTPHPLKDGDPIAFAKELRHIAEQNGLRCNQSHAPFPVRYDRVRALLPLAIECTAEAGGKICIVHPNNDLSGEENAKMFRELLPVAKACGVTIATENMWNGDENRKLPAACSDPKSFLEHLQAVDDPSLAACLDIGHAELTELGTSAPEMIHALGHHLCALHLHDNDHKGDLHLAPYSDSIDFGAVLQALADIGYRGELTLEADSAISKQYGSDPVRGMMELGRVAKRLQAEYDALTK